MTPPPDLTTASDQQLVTLARQGREEASAEIVRRYRLPILALIHRMVGQRERAQDLTQDTFVKVFNRLDTYRAEHKFASWILRVAQRTTLDYLENRRFDSPTSPYAVTPGHIDRAAIGLVERSDAPTPVPHTPELAGMVARALKRLRPDHRECLVRRHVERQSYEEMAADMNLAVGTVKSHTSRARKRLKAILDSWGVTWPTPPAQPSGTTPVTRAVTTA